MKIGIYDPYLDDLGGGEKYMMMIAQCLSKQNDVSVFWDNDSDLKGLLKRFSLDLSSVRVEKNIFSKRVSLIERLKITRKYDAIIVLSDGSIPLVSTKLLVHVQQPLREMQTKSLLDKLKVSRVNSFFCNSKYTKSFIEERFSLKTKMIYPPISLMPKELKKENIVLHVGRFRVKSVENDDYKKQSVMLNAFKKMVDDGLKDWKFILAVSVWDKERDVFEKVKNDASGYPVEFLINKSNKELWDIYSKSKIYWHATGYGEDLDSHPEFAEHFGISTVEAMGAGVVPVVINAGGQKEVVDIESGFLWDSLEELKDKTKELIDDPVLWEKMSKNARQKAKFFSNQDFCQKIQQLVNG
ncbi:MAG: hypothetical protein A2186_00615 [Candidatus Levybacteria bacterium RIFOXYA1_FULL_41_10]|nr:MAG: Glycosyl transferase family 2 [Candidatus Levybacteria bacterium GW2011_GWA2_36_13]KKQ00437.1 MAG: Glycosyl transferase family 2 [Candidatus Levybacteria bacterium GW2011_GWB1_36_18]KKR15013.1 MAG: Glycosyl transferase family 2 [Candidatus Levybacteria bacterium GW2011_GWA1_39_32]KKR51131.1 MAG: Glycosyl transferase family 2 [Candidatus Levybacteria bacterium GW2011_GWC1_40_19]OGH20345.1 MAG: hypothetical protein A2695_02740 [Candidatus Levybacteria bacterium RIFCSPHIGHO2_01_FULL_40_83]